MAKPGNEVFQLLQDLRLEKASGKIYKRFEDDYFALDLLRILYDDTVEASIKTELLIVLEEYGYLGISEESIDQLVTSLVDILHQTADVAENWSIVCQILITSTSLLIQLEQLSSALCNTVVKELVAIVTSRVNQPESHRLRSTACQCLIQLEEFAPGLLLRHYEDISKLARQEKSYVYQDYALLSAKLLSSTARSLDGKTTVILEGNKSIQKQISLEPQDVRQMVAYLVENMPLCSRSGTYRLMESLVYFVKHNPDVSPMVFKPPLLHQMCTMSCVVFHTVLMVQRQFEGEIFNAQEEADLLQRLCIMTDHPSINPLHRLLASQWAHWYKLDVNGRPQIHESIVKNHRLMFYPSVFDTVDLQLRKLYMTALCGDTSQDTDGVETCILLGSLGCLHKIVWHTGSGVAARALFKALCFIYSYHNNQSFSKDIQRFVRGLISEFAHFIPHSLDFADSIRSLNPDSEMYIDTLRLLHQQVVMATEEQIHSSYHFYLLVMKKAAAEKEINQMATLKFMSYLVENAVDINDSGWTLGHSVLDICRNIILCHGTQNYFKENDLLKKPAVSDKGFATLSYLLCAVFVLPTLTLLVNALHKVNTKQMTIYSHHVAYYIWMQAACLLSCILYILNLFDSFINSDAQSKSGKNCYYIYVIEETFIVFVGFCLVSLAGEVMYSVQSSSEHLCDVKKRKFRVNLICGVLLLLSFTLNNIPHISQNVNYRDLYKCWKGNAYEGHAVLAAEIDLVLKGVTVFTMLLIFMVTGYIVRSKMQNKVFLIVPEYMKIIADGVEILGENVEPHELSQRNSSLENNKAIENIDNGQNVENQRNRGKNSLSERDMSSKESSAHENSGYLEDSDHDRDGEQDLWHKSIKANRMSMTTTTANALRRRIKSDSEIPDRHSRKMVEDQVFEALENFFIMDPGKLLYKVLNPQKSCELSAHLIDAEEEKGYMDEETSFNDSRDGKREGKKKSRFGLRKTKSLKSLKEVKERNTWSFSRDSRYHIASSSGKTKSAAIKRDVTSDITGLKLEESNKSSSEDSISQETNGRKEELIVNDKPYSALLEQGGKDKGIAAKGSQMSVNVDVHYSEQNQSGTSGESYATTCTNTHVQSYQYMCSEKNGEHPVDISENVSSDNKNGVKGKAESKVQWEDENCQVTDLNLENGTQGNTAQISREINLSEEVIQQPYETKEEGSVQRIHVAVEEAIEMENNVEEGGLDVEEVSCSTIKEEMLQFKDFYKKYLLKPFESTGWFMLVYGVCLIPQVVLDMYRIVQGKSSTVGNDKDGVMSIVADAVSTIFLLMFTVTFLWRFRKRHSQKFVRSRVRT